MDINLELAEKLADEITANGGRALAVGCDVTDEAQVRAGYEKIAAQLGPIGLAHINAGIIDKPMFIKDISLERWNHIIGINLTGAFLGAKYAVTHMLEAGGGVIVFTGSNWAYVCDPGFTSYAASKGAVVAFARGPWRWTTPGTISGSTWSARAT